MKRLVNGSNNDELDQSYTIMNGASVVTTTES